MPHLVLTGEVDLPRVAEALPRTVYRWGRAVLKTEECWLREDRRAVLVEGVPTAAPPSRAGGVPDPVEAGSGGGSPARRPRRAETRSGAPATSGTDRRP